MLDTLIIKIKQRIRKWLGFGEMFIGVDVGIKDETCIIICSKLNNGQIRILDIRFGNYGELKEFIKEVQQRYGIPDRDIICDMPMGQRALV